MYGTLTKLGQLMVLEILPYLDPIIAPHLSDANAGLKEEYKVSFGGHLRVTVQKFLMAMGNYGQPYLLKYSCNTHHTALFAYV